MSARRPKIGDAHHLIPNLRNLSFAFASSPLLQDAQLHSFANSRLTSTARQDTPFESGAAERSVSFAPWGVQALPLADQPAAPMGVRVRPRRTFSDPLFRGFLEDPVSTTSTGLTTPSAADKQHRECLVLGQQHGRLMSIPPFGGEVLHPERQQSSCPTLLFPVPRDDDQRRQKPTTESATPERPRRGASSYGGASLGGLTTQAVIDPFLLGDAAWPR